MFASSVRHNDFWNSCSTAAIRARTLDLDHRGGVSTLKPQQAMGLPVLRYLVNLDISWLCSDESESGSEYSTRSLSDSESETESHVDRKRKRSKAARQSESKAKATTARPTGKRKESKKGLKTPQVIVFFLLQVQDSHGVVFYCNE